MCIAHWAWHAVVGAPGRVSQPCTGPGRHRGIHTAAYALHHKLGWRCSSAQCQARQQLQHSPGFHDQGAGKHARKPYPAPYAAAAAAAMVMQLSAHSPYGSRTRLERFTRGGVHVAYVPPIASVRRVKHHHSQRHCCMLPFVGRQPREVLPPRVQDSSVKSNRCAVRCSPSRWPSQGYVALLHQRQHRCGIDVHIGCLVFTQCATPLYPPTPTHPILA